MPFRCRRRRRSRVLEFARPRTKCKSIAQKNNRQKRSSTRALVSVVRPSGTYQLSAWFSLSFAASSVERDRARQPTTRAVLLFVWVTFETVKVSGVKFEP